MTGREGVLGGVRCTPDRMMAPNTETHAHMYSSTTYYTHIPTTFACQALPVHSSREPGSLYSGVFCLMLSDLGQVMCSR